MVYKWCEIKTQTLCAVDNLQSSCLVMLLTSYHLNQAERITKYNKTLGRRRKEMTWRREEKRKEKHSPTVFHTKYEKTNYLKADGL